MNIIEKHLRRYISPKDKVLDLGCGNKDYSHISNFTTTVDGWEKTNPYYLLDLERDELPFEENSFDYILMIDFIEHLDKDKGKKVLEDCKKIVQDKIFIFTPLFWDDNSKNAENPRCWAYGNPYDYHKSLWTEKDFSDCILIQKIKFQMGMTWLGYWKK